MSILQDISDVLKDAKNIAKELNVDIGSNNPTSIARLSSQATLQFPVITSRAINVDTAQSVTKALERQYAIFIQMIISLNPCLDLSVDKNMAGYLRKFHQNNIDINDLKENVMYLYNDNEGNSLFVSINEGASGQVIASNKNQLFVVEDYLNPIPLNKMYTPDRITYEQAISTMDYFLKKNGMEIITEAKKNNNQQSYNNNNYNNDIAEQRLELERDKFDYQQDKDNYNKEYQKKRDRIIDARNARKELNQQKQKEIENARATQQYKDQQKQQRLNNARNARKEIEQQRQNEIMNNRQAKMDEHKIQNDKAQLELDREKFQHQLNKDRSDMRSRASVKLADNDVKKCNELVPTTLAVRLTIKDGPSFGESQEFIIGVKGLMHPVNSDEIVSNLLNGFKSGNKFFNFLRWTTGEISFVKDLVLNINNIKDDVVKKHNGGSHWWTTLKRRKTVAKIKNIKGKNKLLPNASIVCTMEEISELKEAYGIDLLNVRNIKKIMNMYFLLGFVIVDDSQEICYFIFDGESNYQAVSYSGLEKENNGKNDFKEIYKLINSGRL